MATELRRGRESLRQTLAVVSAAIHREHNCEQCRNYLEQGYNSHWEPPWSFCIIFLRAARIISSRRFCRRRCRSSLFWDQELLAAVTGDASAFSFAIFALRLYREIKSCPSAFEDEAAVDVACVFGPFAEGIAIWGWNDGGGYIGFQSVYDHIKTATQNNMPEDHRV